MDFSFPNGAMLVLPSGSGNVQLCQTVQTLDDTVLEGGEEFGLTLGVSSPAGVERTSGSPDRTTVMIGDDQGVCACVF